MPGEDYYQVLGVGRDAAREDIEKAYRRLAKKYHPDNNPGGAEAEARLKLIKEAYQVLRDPARRSAYDGDSQPSEDGPPANASQDVRDARPLDEEKLIELSLRPTRLK